MPKVSKKQESAGPKPIFTYGFRVNEAATQLDYDRAAFSDRIQVDRGVPSRYELFRKIAEQTVPGHFEWHDWTIKMVKPLCGEYLPPPQDPRRKTKILLAFPGCASSAKTFNVTGFAMNWWLCNPLHSSVTVVSTTLKSLRRRAWNEVRNFYGKLPGSRFGNFIDSKLIWQAKKGDDRNAVIGKAIEEGPIQKVADDIKGVHTRRQMVIVDEATSVPEAILEACSNLFGYPDEFILVLLGNPFNRMDQFGSFCEPEDGWLSVTVDTPEWDAKPFEKCGGLQPRVVRFDAELSPEPVSEDWFRPRTLLFLGNLWHLYR